MKIEVVIDGKKIVVAEGEAFVVSDQTAASATLLLGALKETHEAICQHRNDILGHQHNYEQDEAYRPEAKLYRQIPRLKAILMANGVLPQEPNAPSRAA